MRAAVVGMALAWLTLALPALAGPVVYVLDGHFQIDLSVTAWLHDEPIDGRNLQLTEPLCLALRSHALRIEPEWAEASARLGPFEAEAWTDWASHQQGLQAQVSAYASVHNTFTILREDVHAWLDDEVLGGTAALTLHDQTLQAAIQPDPLGNFVLLVGHTYELHVSAQAVGAGSGAQVGLHFGPEVTIIPEPTAVLLLTAGTWVLVRRRRP